MRNVRLKALCLFLAAAGLFGASPPAAVRAASPPDPAYAQGVDLSVWNAGTPTGYAFVIARASYGVWADSRFLAHVTPYRNAGKPACAYHFGTAADPVDRQVAVFLKAAKGSHCYALDVEPDPRGRMTDAQARQFIDYMHAAGYQVGLYESAWNFPSDMLGADWAWVASWGIHHPSIPWAIWQWSGSPVDRNEFRGSWTIAKPWFASHARLIPDGPVRLTALSQVRPYLTYFLAARTRLAGYIVNLERLAKPNALQAAELVTYRTRIVVINRDIHFLRDVQTLQRYIANLSAVKRPSPAQKAALATYRDRLTGWMSNPRVL